jgi:hypothetical protein
MITLSLALALRRTDAAQEAGFAPASAGPQKAHRKKASCSMGAGKLRGLGVAAGAAALAALAGGCTGAAPSAPPPTASGQTAPPLTPTMTPSAVPVLGQLTFGTFPGTWTGVKALQLCEDWAGLRGQYVTRVTAGDTPFQLEQWFSGPAWQPAFAVSAPLQVIPAYSHISVTFGLATTGDTASIAQARLLDGACAAAD